MDYCERTICDGISLYDRDNTSKYLQMIFINNQGLELYVQKNNEFTNALKKAK